MHFRYECSNSTNCRHTLGGQGLFIPAEGEGCAVGDGPSRQWFWHPDHDLHAAQKTVGMFWDEYHQSVGLGSNMLMGLTADRRGLVPENDVAKLTAFGRAVRECYGHPAANITASSLQPITIQHPGGYVDLVVDPPITADRVWVREDISTGQRAQEFQVLVQTDRGGAFVGVANGTSIARKRIVVFPESVSVAVLRVVVSRSYEWPVPISEVALFAPCKRP